jgi:hypothetical protein
MTSDAVKFLLLAAFLWGVFLQWRCTVAWRRLGETYGRRDGYPPIAVHSFRWVSARFSGIWLRFSVEITESGLWLQWPFPGSIGSCPRFIPWQDVVVHELPALLGISRTDLRIVRDNRVIRFLGGPSRYLVRFASAQQCVQAATCETHAP